jgi:hypothetical protein
MVASENGDTESQHFFFAAPAAMPFLAGVAPLLVFLPAARPMKQIRPCLCRLKMGARCGVKERADGK